MGKVIQFNKEYKSMENNKMHYSSHEDIDFITARNIEAKISKVKKVNDPTRTKLAENLGELLNEYGRELHKGDLMEKATGTSYIKPSERLSKFQIIPNTTPSVSKKKYLSKSLHDYIKIASAAASLLEKPRSQFIVRLFKDTKFINLDGKDSQPNHSSVLVSETLNRAADLFIKKYELQDYFINCKKYLAIARLKKQIDWDSESKYDFEVDHDNYYYSKGNHSLSNWPVLQLFSIVRSTTRCFHYEIDSDKNKKPKIKERLVASVEVVSLGIIPSGINNIPKLVFYTFPNFVLMPEKVKTNKQKENFRTGEFSDQYEFLTGNSLHVVPKEHGEIHFFGINFKSIPTDFCKIDIKNKLNLQWMKTYSELLSHNEINNLKGKSCTKFPKKILPVNNSSISELIDIPKNNLFKNTYDALSPVHDVSRAISPPNSMLAELEINLFYEGFQSTFDESEKKRHLTMDDYDYDEEGNIYTVERNNEFGDSVLHLLENEISNKVKGFYKWRLEIEKKIRSLAEGKLKEIENNISDIDKYK